MLSDRLKTLEPFTGLDPEALTTVARHARLLELPKGRTLVRRGRAFQRDVYLLKGEVLCNGSVCGPAVRPIYCRGADIDVITRTSVCLVAVDVEPVSFLLHRSTLPSPSLGQVEPWLERLYAAPVLEPLSPSDWQLLLRLGIERGLVEGESFQLDDRVYVVKRGALCYGGIAFEPGSFFGEDFVLAGIHRDGQQAIATAPSRLFSVPGAAIRSVVDGYRIPALPSIGGVEVIDLRYIGPMDFDAVAARLPHDCVVEIRGGEVGTRAWYFTALTQAGFRAKPV